MKMLSKIFCQCVVIIASNFGACTIINPWLQMLKLLVVAWPSDMVICIMLYHHQSCPELSVAVQEKKTIYNLTS